MSYVKDMEDIKYMCRICLTQSDNMVSLDDKLDDESEELIVDALDNTLSIRVSDDTNYPREICSICYGNLRISCGLKVLYNKSQNILTKYISLLNVPLPDNPLDDILNDDSNISKLSLSPYDSVEDEPESVETKPAVLDNKENVKIPIPQNTVKLVIGGNEDNSTKVKWIEGNKFTIEKNDEASLRILYKCLYCEKRFLSKSKLSVHLSICKKDTVLHCEFCNNKFSSIAKKKSHIKLKHSSNPSRVKCEICNEVFKNYNAKSYHKLTRHNTEGKKYRCELCEKAFYIKNSLNQHMECHSRDVSRVVCPVCGKGFHYRGGLFYHMKIHRNERNYICTFCSRRFLTMASLKRHTRIHTGERPYSCSLCSKTFCSVSEVKTHERRHTGQKPHHCKYCKKSFISPYNLKLHVSSHSGAQACDFCEKSFLNNEALKYHWELKHNIKEVTSGEQDVINNLTEVH